MIVTSSQIEYKGTEFRFLVDDRDITIFDMDNNLIASFDKKIMTQLNKELTELLAIMKERSEGDMI